MYRSRSFCFLALEDNRGTYFPGDIIKGKVVCHFREPQNINGIELVFEGTERTEWSFRVSQVIEHVHYREYRSSIQYIGGHNQIFYDSKTLTGKGTINAGLHQYPFTFLLPERLACSFSGEYGNITFSMTGIVKIPFGLDLKQSKGITIDTRIDLNQIPWLNPGPVRYTKTKTLRWLFSTLGTVTMDVYLEKAALAPGESTEVKVELKNSSSEAVRVVNAKIIRFTVEYCDNRITKPKSYHTVLTEDSYVGVKPHLNESYTFNLQIPEGIGVYDLHGSKLFKRWIHLEVNAVFDGIHTDLEVVIPIKMGTVPYKRRDNQIQRAYSASSFNFLYESHPEDDEETVSPSTSTEISASAASSSSK